MKDTGLIGLAQAVANLSAFFIPWSLARFLGDAQLGVFASAYAMAQAISATADAGMRMALIRETARRPEAWRSLLRAAWAGVSALGLLAWIGMFSVILLREGLQGQELRTWLVLQALIWMGFRLTLGVPIGQARFGAVASWSATERLALALVVAGLAWKQVALAHIAEAMCIVEILFLGAVAWWVWRLPGGSKQRVSPWGFWRQALPFGVAALMQGWLSKMDLMVLGFSVHPGPVGQYAAGQTLAYAPLLLANALASALFPRFSAMHGEGDMQRTRHVLMETARALAMLMLLLVCTLAAIAPWIARWVYGDNFGVAGFWMRWFLFASFWGALGALVGAVGNAWGFQGWWARMLMLFLPSALLTFWLVRTQGIVVVGFVALALSWCTLALYWWRLATAKLASLGWLLRTSLAGWGCWFVATYGPPFLRWLLPVLALLAVPLMGIASWRDLLHLWKQVRG